MPSLYLLHAKDQLPADPTGVAEGRVFPLLRRVGGDDATQLAWAYAVPKPPAAGPTADRRRHRLVASVLRALGFVLDANNGAATDLFVKYDFFHLPEVEAEALIKPFDATDFDAATRPVLTGGVGLEVRPPKDGADKLKLAAGADPKRTVQPTATFHVDRFVFDPDGNPGEFRLRGTDDATAPTFDGVRCKPVKALAAQFPSAAFVPALEFAQTRDGSSGTLRCGTSAAVPNNAELIPADTRHDRMTTGTATLVCLLPADVTPDELAAPSLAVEVFPSFTFQPDSAVPVTVSLGHQGVLLRLPPRGSQLPPRVTINRLKPCVRVTVSGPLVQAEASGSGALEALRLLEPAERKLGDSVEQLNDFLTYAFDVCLPEDVVSALTLDDLGQLEGLSFDWPGWPEIPRLFLDRFAAFLDRLGAAHLSVPGFNFRLPKLGLPALTEYELPFQFAGPLLTVTFPDGLTLPPLGIQWRLQLKRPGGVRIDLELVAVAVNGLVVTFTLRGELPTFDVAVDRLVVKWEFEFTIPNVAVPTITLTAALPTVRIPLIGELPDLRFLRVRVLDVNRLTLGTFGVLELTATSLTLDIPDLGGVLTGVTIDVALDLSLSLAKCFLSDLLGELPSVNFRLSVPSLPPMMSLPDVVEAFGSLATPIIPFEFVVRVPSPKLREPEWDELRLAIGFRFDLGKLALADNRIYFFLPQRRGHGNDRAPRQALECDILTLTFPNRPEPTGFPTKLDHDGYFDLASHEFVIELLYPEGKTPVPPPRVKAYFPGGMDKEAARRGREGVGDDPALRNEYAKRFELEFDTIDPKHWPNDGPEKVSFRLGSKGLTLSANLGKTEVVVDDSGFKPDGTADDEADNASTGLIKPFKFQPLDKLRELTSRVVIIDNELKEAAVYAKCEVPGVDGLMAEVAVALRQTKTGTPPEVVASLALERSDHAPLAELSIKLLQLSLDRVQMGLVWRTAEKDWDYSVLADGTLAFTGAAALAPDLEGLRAPSIQVIGLDLRRLNLRALRVPLKLVKPVRFDMLDGLFAVELGDLVLAWEFTNKLPRPTLLSCELAKFEFKNPGALEVAVAVGGLNVEFAPDLSVHVKLPSSLGIEVALGPTARFAGRVGWVETPTERYLFASGKLALQGFPETQALLKFGTGLKFGGRREINVVLYGEQALDEQLFPGAVVKSLGVGVGLNNRLAVLPPRPSADQILARIDRLNPADVDGWQFVRDDGFYLSIVGAVTLASNVGAPDVLNAYVARLVVSFDTNFDLTAAGKLWLSCSVDGVRGHPNNPAFVGAMVLSPREHKLEVVLESRTQAYVEKNDLIRKLLDKGKARFAFRMTPALVDYHLAELSYADTMFGVPMEFRGEYRFAVFKRAVLLKSELSATGRLSRSLNAGPGGFDLDGQAHLAVGYGGLLSERGVMAYAFLDAGIRFRVSAWIEIGFSISFRVCGKRFSKSWHVTFRLRVPELELTFRGVVAASDRGGLVGVDVQVGINVVVCGYRLNASGRLAVNPELCQEVRATVAAFEDELDAAVKKLEGATPLPPPPHALAPVGMNLAAPEAAAPVEPPAVPAAKEATPERWLLYTRTLETGTKAALPLPAGDSTWLTPTIASVDELTLTKTGAIVAASFAVHAPHAAAFGQAVRLFGLRGKDVPVQLNGTWPVLEATASRLTLNVTPSGVAVRSEPYPLFGGIWSVVETVAGLEPDDHLTVPYLNDVERVVLPLAETWVGVGPFAPESKQLTCKPHGLAAGAKLRVLLRTSARVLHDRGTTRKFDENDIAAATFAATVIDGTTLLMDALEPGEEFPDIVGYSFVPAVELAPTWNARNRAAWFRERKPTAAEYRDLAAAAAEWAETARNDNEARVASPSTAGYKVVFDARWESADPRYAVPQPDPHPGVLPTRFRPLGEVEVVGGDEVLRAAKAYEVAAKLVARQELRGALDLLDDDAAVQARAQAANRLVHRFSDPAGMKPDDHPEARYVPLGKDPSAIAYGWPFSAPSTLVDTLARQPRAYVRRAGGPLTEVAVVVPGATKPMLPVPRLPEPNLPKTLPARQEYVVDETTPAKELGRVRVKLPIRLPDDWLTGRPEEVGRFQIYRRVGGGPEILIADHLRPDVSYLHAEQTVVPRPVLFTDEFAVVDRAFADRDLQALHGGGSFPTARYRLRVVPEGDAGDDPSAGVSVAWPDPVPLFVPAPAEAPRTLALAVPVASLIEGAKFAFELVDLSGAYPVLARRGDLADTAADFEIGLDDEVLKQTGYYAGDDAGPRAAADSDGSTLTLRGVRADDAAESDHGKAIASPVPDKGHACRFTLPTTAIAVGNSYRVFLRAKSPAASGPLRRLPILLLRDFPTVWDETVRYQAKETLERIPESHLEAVAAARAEPLVVEFSADDLYAAGRSAVRAVWPSVTRLDGGVELQFRDFDDSSVRSRTLVEVLEADQFAVARQDFRNEDDWTPRPADRVEWHATRHAVGAVAAPGPATLNVVYLWKNTAAEGHDPEVDRLRWLRLAGEALGALGALGVAPSWDDVAGAVREAQVALLAFEKSPLNLNRPAVRGRIELIRYGLRALVVGTKFDAPLAPVVTNDPAADALAKAAYEAAVAPAADAARQSLQRVLELLTTVEQVPVTSLSNDAGASAAFLDRDTSRKLAGIVRRRLAVADEVLSLAAVADDLPAFAGAVERLARQAAWERIVADAVSLEAKPDRPLDTLPRTNDLAKAVDIESWTPTRAAVAALLESLPAVINDADLGRLVPRAAGLTTLLKAMDGALGAGTVRAILKRPHHELTTTRTAAGEVVAMPVPLRNFLPPDARRAKPGEVPRDPDERLDRLGLRVGRVATLDANGLVAVWTTRGESVENTPLRRVQQFAVGAGARGIELAETEDGPRALVGFADRFELWDAGAPTRLPAATYAGAAAGVFAHTPRGMEVLTRTAGAAGVSLRSVESATRKPQEFQAAAGAAPLDGPVAYHDEALLVAACRGATLTVWRDLGRPLNATPMGQIAFGEPIVAIRPVTLPAGDCFIVATAHWLSVVDPLAGTESKVADVLEVIVEMVVDRRKLTAAIRTGHDKIFVIDLVTYVRAELIDAPSPGLATLHGRTGGEDRSFTVAPDAADNVALFLGTDKVQTLPKPAELGAAGVKILALSAALLTARSARSAPDVMNLFHLWERMGFALDVAARNDATRLLPFADLRALVANAVEAMRTRQAGDHACRVTVQGEPHYVYVVEGEEPDAEFREQDRVGFAHVKVAVVPESFLKACLADDPAAAQAWLGYRSIEVPEDAAIRSGELAHLRHLAQLVGVPTADRLGAPKVAPAAGLDNGTVRAQPRAERFVRVPAAAGLSHWTWTLPDRKGHRMMAAARRVSRYEPLLRWWLNLHTRFDLPYEKLPDGTQPPGWRMVTLDPVHDPRAGDGPQPLMVYQYPSARRPQFSYQIPLDGMRSTYNQISRVRTGWHGVELSFRYDLPQQADGTQPTLQKLLDATTTAATTGVPTRTTTTVPLGPELDVRLFRHERMLRLPELPFFYRYRLDVRSAYKSRLLEHDRATAADLLPDDVNHSPPAPRLPACLGLNAFKLEPMTATGVLPEGQPADLTQVRLPASAAEVSALEPRELRVRATPEDEWVRKAVEQVGAGLVTVTAAFTVQPASGWQFELESGSGFEATFFVSANRDHLTREETASEPEPIAMTPKGGVEIPARDLPDFVMGYSLFSRQSEGGGPLPSLGDLFSAVGSIQMPWSPDFKVPDGVAKDKPFVSLATGLTFALPDTPVVMGTRAGSVPLERITINVAGGPYWRLRFRVINDRGLTLVRRETLSVQGRRDGRLTRAVAAT